MRKLADRVVELFRPTKAVMAQTSDKPVRDTQDDTVVSGKEWYHLSDSHTVPIIGLGIGGKAVQGLAGRGHAWTGREVMLGAARSR